MAAALGEGFLSGWYKRAFSLNAFFTSTALQLTKTSSKPYGSSSIISRFCFSTFLCFEFLGNVFVIVLGRKQKQKTNKKKRAVGKAKPKQKKKQTKKKQQSNPSSLHVFIFFWWSRPQSCWLCFQKLVLSHLAPFLSLFNLSSGFIDFVYLFVIFLFHHHHHFLFIWRKKEKMNWFGRSLGIRVPPKSGSGERNSRRRKDERPNIYVDVVQTKNLKVEKEGKPTKDGIGGAAVTSLSNSGGGSGNSTSTGSSEFLSFLLPSRFSNFHPRHSYSASSFLSHTPSHAHPFSLLPLPFVQRA
jgi:hypothetical protein